MRDEWPEPAVDFVQAIADTKLVLSHRYAQWSLAGPSLEDDIGGASAAQEEIGHARQLFRLLEQQGRDGDWLRGDREPEEFANAASLDHVGDDWVSFIGSVGPADRAAWYLLDAIDHEDFGGLVTKMGEDEYFHLEYHDARLETLAAEQTEAIQSVLETAIPAALALIGPGSRSEDADPVYASGFTTRSVAELRDAFAEHYRDLVADTPISGDDFDWEAPSVDGWDDTRRRADPGGLDQADLEMLRGSASQEFVVE
ncbi:MAG: Phenylacetic acid catabolic protein [Halobacteriales archaeon]